MKKARVYTKTGDKGETSLVSGTRLSKAENQIDLYGEVDELNSHIGHMFSLMNKNLNLKENPSNTLIHLQKKLFDLGSLLACEPEFWEKYKLPKIKDSTIKLLEEQMDLMDAALPELKHFILPGGNEAATYAHVVRTVCRRCERKLIHFRNQNHQIPENSIELLNRMSDYFFMLARYINLSVGFSEQIWTNEG